MFDYLIVGSGLFGSVCAHELNKQGKKVKILEKREHVGGNVYTEKQHGVNLHKYGAHIFHTNNKEVWDYVNSFIEFNRFTNSPLARYKDKLLNKNKRRVAHAVVFDYRLQKMEYVFK